MNVIIGKSLFTRVFQKCLRCRSVFYFQFKFHFSFIRIMNIIKGNSSCNDFAHNFKFYIPRNVEKFHSYQRIAVAGLGGKKKSTLILHYPFKNKVLKLAFSTVLSGLQRCPIRFTWYKDKEEKWYWNTWAATHLWLFSVVGEVVQVEGAVHGVVVHLQRASLVTLFVKQESSSVGKCFTAAKSCAVCIKTQIQQSG